MNYSRRVEANLAEFYELIPNLPKYMRVWLANNAWWVTLVGTVCCAIGMFMMIPIFFTAVVLMSWGGDLLSPTIPYENSSLGMTWLASLLSSLVFFVIACILAFAVGPLRRKSKSGWDGLFRSIVLIIVLGLVCMILTPSWVLFTIVIVGSLVVGYLLFEIRSEFHYTVRSDQKHVNPE